MHTCTRAYRILTMHIAILICYLFPSCFKTVWVQYSSKIPLHIFAYLNIAYYRIFGTLMHTWSIGIQIMHAHHTCLDFLLYSFIDYQLHMIIKTYLLASYLIQNRTYFHFTCMNRKNLLLGLLARFWFVSPGSIGYLELANGDKLLQFSTSPPR